MGKQAYNTPDGVMMLDATEGLPYELVKPVKAKKAEEVDNNIYSNPLDPELKTCCACLPVKCGLSLLGCVQILNFLYIAIELFVMSVARKTVFDEMMY